MLPVNTSVEFQTSQLNLTETHSSFFWGRTLVFEGPSLLCATIMVTYLEVKAIDEFSSPIIS